MCLGKSVVVPAVMTYLLGCLAYLLVLVVLCGLYIMGGASIQSHTRLLKGLVVVGTNIIYP